MGGEDEICESSSDPDVIPGKVQGGFLLPLRSSRGPTCVLLAQGSLAALEMQTA